MKKPIVRKMKNAKNHDKTVDGGRLVKCSVCGHPGLVDEKDADTEVVCELCDEQQA